MKLKLLLSTLFLFVSTCLFYSSLLVAQGVGFNPFPNSFQNVESDACLNGSSSASLDVFFDFYKAGVTDFGGPGPGVSCTVRLRGSSAGPDGSFSNATPIFQTLSAVYVSDSGNNDRFRATVPVGTPNGRYSWECSCTHGGTEYLSWDYATNSGNSLQYFTVGSAGLFRSMAIFNVNGTPSYYDMLHFQPGNTPLPTTINGNQPDNGFCTDEVLRLGSEINTYKNNWYGQVGNVCGNSMVWNLSVTSANAPCSPGTSVNGSISTSFRDNCPSGYINTFVSGGSCQNQDGNALDQRWDNVCDGAGVCDYTSNTTDIMAQAIALCDPNSATGPVTYNLCMYTLTTMDCNGGCDFVLRDPPGSGTYCTSFQITGDADGPGGCAMILPVELSSFTAVQKGKTVELKWETASEINASHFIVQRSEDGSRWNDISDKIEAAGTTNRVQNYAWIDDEPNANNYYRLLQEDHDGTEYLSEIKTVNFEAYKNLELFPNPTRDVLNIAYPSELSVSIYDQAGRLLLKSSRKNIDMTELAKGIYLVEVIDQFGVRLTTEKVIKL